MAKLNAEVANSKTTNDSKHLALKIPSKWENFAHNGLICFFQHNYIPTFEQWLWDRVCVLSTWFGDICGIERTFVCFTKSHEHFISNSIRCGCLRTDQCNIACSKAAININALAIDRRPPCEAATNCAVWSPPCESAGAAAISILFLDTLCSKKWYDMPHIGCGIHSLQCSTIPRIGRHLAGYS